MGDQPFATAEMHAPISEIDTAKITMTSRIQKNVLQPLPNQPRFTIGAG